MTERFVRPYTPADLEDVRTICFETGYMGEPIAWQFDDRTAFCELFCDWHVLHHPDTAWVVDDGGHAVGYLIGCPDVRGRFAREADWPVDLDRFPADLHINLLPAARGQRFGRALVTTWFERLVELGGPGVHLGTWGENAGAISFFRSVGFIESGERSPNLFRLRDGELATVAHFTRPVL